MARDAQPFAFAQDKLTFLLALVPYLIDLGRVSVAEAAAHFQVTEKQIRDAVTLIAVSGVPGETTQYQHGDLFDISWDDFDERDEIVITHMVALDDSPRFSAREAAALIAGLQYLQSLPENVDSGVYSSLMDKLARGASERPSQVAIAGSDTTASLAEVRDAVARRVQIEFDYLSARGSRERRTVDPLRIDSDDENWYLRAWDHARSAVRTFRLDRMTGIAVTATPATGAHDDVPLGDRLFVGGDDDLMVTIELDPSAMALLGEFVSSVDETAPAGAPGADARQTASGRVRTRIRVAHMHSLKRLVTAMPSAVTIVDPPEARAAVVDWATAALDRYRTA
ncbi:WYL domain-containing protein [Herbiconiux sp. VKM Ac-1786]|uniref:helix-turn-helix transcriptional regulator n=1 Tax=Herbiconiux sp. VKM Ac-1786 TaxID=2783824 RepID=UPI00188D395E|nr:WYL domain-containing protein [Herbiconiux sp. VKM Ac-1786]MBF4573518.1 WYL domain-containing protein [Herbiconiux sp. VKM Ac-1786]